jgi:hypothetical protein
MLESLSGSVVFPKRTLAYYANIASTDAISFRGCEMLHWIASSVQTPSQPGVAVRWPDTPQLALGGLGTGFRDRTEFGSVGGEQPTFFARSRVPPNLRPDCVACSPENRDKTFCDEQRLAWRRRDRLAGY